MSERGRSNSHCVYCGVFLTKQRGTGAWANREHAVGRQLFMQPRPDLSSVVVPGCRGCNERFKPDEDYFRSMLSLTDAGESAVGRVFHERIGMRVYDHDHGLRKKIARSLEGVRLQSPRTRRVVKEGMTQRVDWPRIHRVVAKWIIGIYWKKYGERLPAGLPLTTAYQPIAEGEAFDEGLGWPGTFEYRHARSKDDPHSTRWAFRVWGTFGLFARTNEPDTRVGRTTLIDNEFPGHIIEHFPLVVPEPEPPKPLIIVSS